MDTLRITSGIVVLAALLATGCGSDSPTEPTDPTPQLTTTSAQAYVDGTRLAGSTRQQGFGEGSPMLFEGVMMQGGMPGAGYTMWMEYDRPQMGGGCCGGMAGGRHSGRTQLYDDGTHGDVTPGDGIYHFEDFQGEFGCQRRTSPPGEYHYEFYGEHHDGTHTNQIGMTITIEG